MTTAEAENDTGGLQVVGLDYCCRVCEHTMCVYVAPDEGHGGVPTITHSHKLTRQGCPECGDERTFVLAEWLELDPSDRPDHDGPNR